MEAFQRRQEAFLEALAVEIHTKRSALKVEAVRAGSCIVDLVCEVHSTSGNVEALGDAEVEILTLTLTLTLTQIRIPTGSRVIPVATL